MPTTTRSGIVRGQDLEGEAAPGEPVVDAALHERRAVRCAPLEELLAREPVQRQNLRVDRARLHALDAAAKAKAQERDVRRRIVPAVDADERRGLEAVRGFLQHLAPARRNERLGGIK